MSLQIVLAFAGVRTIRTPETCSRRQICALEFLMAIESFFVGICALAVMTWMAIDLVPACDGCLRDCGAGELWVGGDLFRGRDREIDWMIFGFAHLNFIY